MFPKECRNSAGRIESNLPIISTIHIWRVHSVDLIIRVAYSVVKRKKHSTFTALTLLCFKSSEFVDFCFLIYTMYASNFLFLILGKVSIYERLWKLWKLSMRKTAQKKIKRKGTKQTKINNKEITKKYDGIDLLGFCQ